MTSKLNDLDLNLLKLLEIVVETQSTTEAAERLEISQASVSRGLTKLREVFGDTLFIRKAHGIEPSELAIKLAQASQEMLQPLNKVIESYQGFDASTFKGKVKIAMNIVILDLHGDGIFKVLRENFPCADFEMIYWGENSLAEMLAGEIDYMLHFEARTFPQEVFIQTLREVKLCFIARKAHPILSKTSQWEDIHHLPLARVIVDGVNTKRSQLEKLYIHKGYNPRVSLATHSIRLLIDKLVHSDAISLGSPYVCSLDERLQSYPLPPVPIELMTSRLCGGYPQSKRNYPLNQVIHQTIQCSGIVNLAT
ncbi:LysR family transcriptional regulator [Vibrio agarivorans]|uniref:LysR family transcriptional regulator n=1 Tax=Vibrio agarivorans TaxID=153622 RepID=A0ABT7Y4D8_9VIBR|nr:LysR family transcriptional regulator [Vibrio agarivorans]MDN2482902.1 LysR family transcriptional regulator [Vibrio agarivorans]